MAGEASGCGPRPEMTALAKSFIKDHGSHSKTITAAELKRVLMKSHGSSPGVVPLDSYDMHVRIYAAANAGGVWPQVIDHVKLAGLLESITGFNENRRERESANDEMNGEQDYE